MWPEERDPGSGEECLSSVVKQGWALRVVSYFNDFRSVEGWWEEHAERLTPEFVEWVEEQRSKAA